MNKRREQEALTDLLHELIDEGLLVERNFVVQNSIHDPFCPCPDCSKAVLQAVRSPLVKREQEPTGKTLVARSDLDEWRKLFERVASLLQHHYDCTNMQEDEDVAVECEQTAEMIEGFYLPYNEQGVYISEKE